MASQVKQIRRKKAQMAVKTKTRKVVRHTKDSKTKYVIDKSKTAEDMYFMLHKKPFKFNIKEQFSDHTFDCYRNLKKENTLEYMILLSSFLHEKDINTDMERLVWTSEILDVINNNHDKILRELKIKK